MFAQTVSENPYQSPQSISDVARGQAWFASLIVVVLANACVFYGCMIAFIVYLLFGNFVPTLAEIAGISWAIHQALACVGSWLFS